MAFLCQAAAEVPTVKKLNLVLTCLLDCSSKPQSQFNLTCPNFSCQVRGQVRLGVKIIVPFAGPLQGLREKEHSSIFMLG